MSDAWVFRAATDDDRSKILSSWLVSLADARVIRDYIAFVHRGDRDAYFATYEPIVKALLERCTVMVAGVTGAPTRIVGWAAFEEPDVLHYVWVKGNIRRCGLMTDMLRDWRDLPMIVTHPPRDPRIGDKFESWGWKYRPWYRWPDAKGQPSDIPPESDPFPQGHPYRRTA